MTKKLGVIFGALLVASNLIWAYIAFEQQLHIGYLANDTRSISHQKKSFKQVCDHVFSDIEALQAKKIAQQLHPKAIIFTKEGALHLDWYSIQLNNEETKTTITPCRFW